MAGGVPWLAENGYGVFIAANLNGSQLQWPAASPVIASRWLAAWLSANISRRLPLAWRKPTTG